MSADARFAACTVVARNYTAFAEVLRTSFLTWNPDAEFVTLLVDGTEEDRTAWDLGEVMLLEDLGLSAEELEPMVVMYDVVELATALKPAMLRAMRARGFDGVAYLDPDIWVLGSLDDVFTGAAQDSIVLTPHALQPVPRDGCEISERTIMHAGIFNLGFIAVGPGSEEFLDWWHERLTTDAVVDFENALFTDQRWIDWVPALFPHRIARDPGLNVAYWNIHERPLERDSSGGFLAAGTPLRFFHFSGFDLARPWELSRFTGDNPRVVPSEHELLSVLCRAYADALDAAGHLQRRALGYRHAEVSGIRLTPEIRRVYRDALKGTIPLHAPPPLPVSEPEQLGRWLWTPVQCAPWSSFAPADVALWRSRPDLQRSFPSLFGSASSYYRAWLDESAEVDDHYAAVGLPEPRRSAPRESWSAGWSVIAAGDPVPSDDVVELADRIGWELARSGLPFEVVRRDGGGSGPADWVHTGPGAGDMHDNVVVCVDAENFSEDRIVQALADRRGRRVALWLGAGPLEIEHRRLLEGFDEFWVVTPREHARLSAATPLPVVLVDVPPADGPGDQPPAAPDWLPDADGPRFLVPVDASASIERQNPEAAVEAYVAAIGEADGALLVVHVRAGSLSRRARESLRHVAGDRKDVVILEHECDEHELHAAVAAAEVVVSLHRALVYGSPLVSAARAGTPLVITAGDGDVELDPAAPVHRVPYGDVGARLRRAVGRAAEDWVEPDVAAAVGALRAAADGRPPQDERIADPAARVRVMDRLWGHHLRTGSAVPDDGRAR